MTRLESAYLAEALSFSLPRKEQDRIRRGVDLMVTPPIRAYQEPIEDFMKRRDRWRRSMSSPALTPRLFVCPSRS